MCSSSVRKFVVCILKPRDLSCANITDPCDSTFKSSSCNITHRPICNSFIFKHLSRLRYDCCIFNHSYYDGSLSELLQQVSKRRPSLQQSSYWGPQRPTVPKSTEYVIVTAFAIVKTFPNVSYIYPTLKHIDGTSYSNGPVSSSLTIIVFI